MKNFKLLIVLLLLLEMVIAFQQSPLRKKTGELHQAFSTISQKKPLIGASHDLSKHIASNKKILFTKLSYPNASEITKTDNTLVLQSTDDPALITDWYKSFIQKKEFSNKTFVQTKIGDDTHNKLIGAMRLIELSVEINRNHDDTATTITVTISSS